jgi:hypothetical protein
MQIPKMDAIIWYEERGQRCLELSLMIRLYNYQCETIGMNQILNTFMLQVSKEKSTVPTVDCWIQQQMNWHMVIQIQQL